ncbi:MAG: LysR family transcriptional regulator [Gemmobacter sp.]
MRPSLRQLDAFLTVAATGSFSQAARRLGSTQPGISQTIRDLEALLGLRLLHRTTRRVTLTEAGEAFRAAVAPSLAALDRAADAARDHAALRRGRVRLAAPPFLAATLLPPLLAGFHARHPGLMVELLDLPTTAIVAALRADAADLGLGTFPATVADFARRPVLTDPMTAFAPCGTLPDPARWADLAGQPVIAMAPASALRLPTDLGFEVAGLPLVPAHQVQGIATALALAAAGLGVAVLPGHARAAMPPGLAAHPLTAPVITRDLVLAHGPDRPLSPGAAALSDHLAQALRRPAP